VDHRPRLQLGHSQRAEDHQRQGRRSQRPRSRDRLTRSNAAKEGPGSTGPSVPSKRGI
jgi:hypothetical protein